jgi:beta-lactamase class D
MADGLTSIIRSLELSNQSLSQDLSLAQQRVVQLEQQVSDLLGPEASSVDLSSETQINFIQRVAKSRTKFSKEAQQIIDAIDNSSTEEPISDE